MPSIRVRPASSTEGAAYLDHPRFSACTVPIVWYPMWNANLAHFFRDNAAKVWGVLRDTPWARNVKWVMVTAEGHAAPQMNHDIMQPLVSQQVETWADFTNRLPSSKVNGGFVPADGGEGGADSLPPSFEGGPQRCFRRMFVCNRGINITSWPLHGLGQGLAAHYAGAVQLTAAAQATSHALESATAQAASQVLESAAAVAAAQKQPNQAAAHKRPDKAARDVAKPAMLPTNSSAGSEQVLRIIFHKRASADRQLLNADELVKSCNAWRHTAADGRRLRASCTEVEMADLFTGIAAAQQADVFVGVHGANMANAWLMRPGSSMIELQPFGFDSGAAHLQYPLFNLEDKDSEVLWWLISVCDPQAWTPGTSEAAGEGHPAMHSKFRNLVVRWQALQTVLEAVVDANGNMTDYRQRWAAGRWWWFMGSGGSMKTAGRGRRTKMRCPASD
ncbi:hypothetical protein D9Q98_006566 [Chlorella vulgaris]|uniref:Glycosyltransferase 61 catalytic domain-containing protein n=1 Tax=Chlorella vulgaris TaxID=3077 RepID=A0A9D4YV72_CHLVU|nr:hypothetical protein D9Q98_006566 [Chlorella vulgaris]